MSVCPLVGPNSHKGNNRPRLGTTAKDDDRRCITRVSAAKLLVPGGSEDEKGVAIEERGGKRRTRMIGGRERRSLGGSAVAIQPGLRDWHVSLPPELLIDTASANPALSKSAKKGPASIFFTGFCVCQESNSSASAQQTDISMTYIYMLQGNGLFFFWF